MKAAKSNKTGFALKSRRALWVLPFVIGGSLWAAVETHRYLAALDTEEQLTVAATETPEASIAENNVPDDNMLEVEAIDSELDPVTLDGEIEADIDLDSGISLDLDSEEPSEFLTVEEILSEDLDAVDEPSEKDATPPEEEEFVNLNEILYGTTDEEEIRKIRAQEEGIEQPSRKSLELEMQALKGKVLEINRDLFLLEEDLLFPSSTQINVFVSFDAKEYFSLDGVTLKMDDRPVSNHLYTKRESKALERGAVQRLFTGNLPTGDHELVAVVTGMGPEGRDYRRAISLDFVKSSGTKYIELKIIGDDLRKQPIFQLREWD